MKASEQRRYHDCRHEQGSDDQSSRLHSKSKVTAYDGWHVKGLPVETIVRGETIMKNGEIVHKPIGHVVKLTK
ncbi:hypothetical protein [Sporolactobacillus nakayamae]|uniref:hypothetical protein n=1 Tax=Sporolactobacillus nakayamae TaxID=269670 RepID=UPI001FE20017|nr:hypothetical protein [Sporolactobacillus nakayamae]